MKVYHLKSLSQKEQKQICGDSSSKANAILLLLFVKDD